VQCSSPGGPSPTSAAHVRAHTEATQGAATESFTTAEVARVAEAPSDPEFQATHAVVDECHTTQTPIIAAEAPARSTGKSMVRTRFAVEGTSTTTGPIPVAVASNTNHMAPILVAAPAPSTITGPRCVVEVSAEQSPMAHTLDAAAASPTTPGPRSVAAVASEPGAMAHTHVVVADQRTTPGPRSAVAVLSEPGHMACTLAAVAGPPTTTGPRCVAKVSSEPSPMVRTLVAVVPISTTTTLPPVAATGT